MKTKQQNMLHLYPNESIMLSDQAFVKQHSRSGWKPGHLTLTNKRLVLRQSARDIFETSLEAISAVSTEKKGFILRSVHTLCLTFREPFKSDSEGSKSRASMTPVLSRFKHPHKVWIVVKEPDKWQKEIFTNTKLQVSADDIKKIAGELGPESCAILLYIWEERHASIQQLSKLYDSPNHMEVLNRIRNIINPVSEKVVGFPILVFERSRIDPASCNGHVHRNLVNMYDRPEGDSEAGEKILFSWWIIGARKAKKEFVEPLMDIFDEEDHIVFVTELKGVREEDILIVISGNHLKLSCDSPALSLSEDILLPAKVDSGSIEKRYHNGILEVKLQKDLGEAIGHIDNANHKLFEAISKKE